MGGVRGLHPDDRDGRVALLQRAIFHSDRLRGLAERPLLLTLMASLHAWRGGSLPEKREELYHDVVDLLLDWWEQPKIVRNKAGGAILQQPSLAEWLKVDRQRVRSLLSELAYKAHKSQPNLTGTADIPEERLVCGLMRLNPETKRNPVELVDYLSWRAGLLLPRGVQVYTFPHRTFQEYLAACYLTDHESYPDLITKLVLEDPNRWREVALLAAAKAARGASSTVWQIIESLCYQDLEKGKITEEQCWGAHIAGQIAVESANLEIISRPNQEKIDRVKKNLTMVMQNRQFPAVERCHAGDSLGQLGEPRREVMSIDAMQFCGIPSGSFWQGSDESDDEKPLHLNKHLNDHFWLGRFPITHAQYEEFVNSGGYGQEAYWIEAKEAGVRTKDGIQDFRDESSRTCPRDYGLPFNLPNHPVVGVSWYEALAFTRWLTERWHKEDVISRDWCVSLPSEAEWEKGARGGIRIPKSPVISVVSKIVASRFDFDEMDNPSPKSRYPWGDKIDMNHANYDETGIGTTNVVGAFPSGKSPYGCEELSGNVWEWTRSLWGKSWSKSDFGYPYNPNDGREDLQANRSMLQVLRGRSFAYYDWFLRCSYRDGNLPSFRLNGVGFRVVLSPRCSNSEL